MGHGDDRLGADAAAGGVERYWTHVRGHLGIDDGRSAPAAWAFGATARQADELAALVVTGAKTATSSALWDYELDGEALPTVGEHSIVLDGAGRPCCLIVVTDVAIVAFDEVDAVHARLEGEGDLSLQYWRGAHEAFFRETSRHRPPFAPDMPVVLERFAVLHVAER